MRQARHIHQRLNVLPNGHYIYRAFWRWRLQMNSLEFVYHCLIFEVRDWRIGTNLRIECRRLCLHRNNKCWERCNEFFNSSFPPRLNRRLLGCRHLARRLRYILHHRWWYRFFYRTLVWSHFFIAVIGFEYYLRFTFVRNRNQILPFVRRSFEVDAFILKII